MIFMLMNVKPQRLKKLAITCLFTRITTGIVTFVFLLVFLLVLISHFVTSKLDYSEYQWNLMSQFAISKTQIRLLSIGT